MVILFFPDYITCAKIMKLRTALLQCRDNKVVLLASSLTLWFMRRSCQIAVKTSFYFFLVTFLYRKKCKKYSTLVYHIGFQVVYFVFLDVFYFWMCDQKNGKNRKIHQFCSNRSKCIPRKNAMKAFI